METAEALAVLPPPTIFDMTQRINPINEETDACTFLRMCCTRKDINQDKDETNFVQIVLAIKTISPNIYIERASLRLINVYLTVILFAPIVIHRGNWY